VRDCSSAVGAVDRCGFDGAVAGGAVRDRECSGRSVRAGGAEDLVGDVNGLSGVVLTDSARHEEALDPGDDHGDTGPRKQKLDDAGGVATKIEVMNADAAEEEREEDADDLVFAGALVFSVEPGTLMLVHVCGVDGIGGLHVHSPRR